MSKLRTSILSIALSACSGALFAQGADAGTKLAFVNTTAVLQGSAEGKQELARIEAFVAERRKTLDAQTNELQTLQQEYNSKLRMLNPTTAAEMQAQITEKDRQVRRAQEDFELEVNRRQNQLFNQMAEKIKTVIEEYATQNQIGAVFLDNPSLPYFAPTLDITDTIVKLYDEKHPVAGQAAAPAPAP